MILCFEKEGKKKSENLRKHILNEWLYKKVDEEKSKNGPTNLW